MNAKMNDPKCVTRKIKIAPHDYSKENFLATFTPHKQLTPEQIFWSNDLMKLKSEALKERTKVSRPIKALTVVSVATNSELNVVRFTEMHVANTSVEARCLVLEAELANLRDKNNHDNQKELINHFSKLKVNHLNLQIKYQNLKDSIGNNSPTPDKDTPDFDSVFVIGKMQASLQGKDNVIRQVTVLTTKNVKLKAQTLEKVNSVSKDQVKPNVLALGKHAIDVEPIVPRLRNNKDAHLDYLRHLKESVEIIRDIVDEAKVVRPLDRSIVFACRYTKHSQELLEYAK
nr:hypothetical protein [Tanacetum cinerariifolium]